MKRERKDRAWDGEKMHYGVVPWQWDFVISLLWHRCERSTGSGFLGSGGKEADFLVPGIRFEELMDYTGLFDKNNKEIYEGDIVEVDWQDPRYPVHNRAVVWDSKNAGWLFEGGSPDIDTSNYMAVIGNIYENPELLQQSTSITDQQVKK
jgi:hypothetical protein